MSIRTIARSSSNRKSASARASSVLPVPVGPRNRNDPVGRLGSLMPARARRTASLTAVTAARWPISRSPMTVSISSSFAVSPWSIRPVGMPVHASTTSAICSGPTSSPTRGSISDFSMAADSASERSSWGICSNRICDALRRFSSPPSRCSFSACTRTASSRRRSSPSPSRVDFSRSQRTSSARSSSCLSARSARIFSSRSTAASSASLVSANSSIFIRSTRRRSSSISSGTTRSPSAAGMPPRRSGRSPCRAAGGR